MSRDISRGSSYSGINIWGVRLRLCLVERIAVAGSCGIFLERSCGWSLGILKFFESFWRGVFDEAGRIDSVAEELSVFFFLFSFLGAIYV